MSLSVTLLFIFFFFFNDPATTEIYTLSLHDALPILPAEPLPSITVPPRITMSQAMSHTFRSEEHTSELQSLRHLVCRLLLEKKKSKCLSVTKCTSLPDYATYGFRLSHGE